MRIQRRYQKAVDEFIRRALEKYKDRIDTIILFGSVARGEAREDSDIDILIVTKEEDFRLRHILIGIAFDILLETEENISVKALSKNDFEKHKNFSFLRNVISEGVKVA
ncbi:MAG TPA: nucleotidyltransferase domain-containing protein [Thermoplasmata archaeon]|nr:nucleotidyltransferase domain-containing protein [Thermoplasmata archaeon]